MVKPLTEEEYDRRITVHGKVLRVEPFKGTKTKILHICLEHNETHLGLPETLSKGHGLICCLRDNLNRKRAREVYDEKLAAISKAVRVGKYTKGTDKILHRCLIHGEEHYAMPMNLLVGQGLICCGAGNLARLEARDTYDEKIKKVGRVVRVEEYINANEKILHRCLEHGQIHPAKPSNILNGCGLACCKNSLTDSLKNLILFEKSKDEQDAYEICVYLFKMSNYPDHLKLGISVNLKERSRDEQYGEFTSSWHTDSRLEAYCVEQASLRDIMLPRSCPDKLRADKWNGYTEVVNCSEQTAIDVIQFYWNKMNHLGPYQFALDYLNPTSEETELLMSALPTC